MNRLSNRIGLVVAVVSAVVLGTVTQAFAAADSSIVTPLTTASGSFKDTLLACAAIGLGVAASVYALRRGWRLLKTFVG